MAVRHEAVAGTVLPVEVSACWTVSARSFWGPLTLIFGVLMDVVKPLVYS